MEITKIRPFKLFLALLYLVSFGAILLYAYRGSSYYATPLLERPHHPDFWDLKPGGGWGMRSEWWGRR